MESPIKLIEYIRAYRNAATQLRDLATGRRWWELEFDLNMAVAFANRGFLPDEATALFCRVISGSAAHDAEDFQDLINVLNDVRKMRFGA